MTIAVSFEAPRDVRLPLGVKLAGWAMLWLAFLSAAAILGMAAALKRRLGPPPSLVC